MAENKKSFIAYVDWKETFDALPDEKAGQLVKHLFAYVNDENPETDDVLIKAVFANIKHQLKRDLKKWESLSAQRAEIGRLGGIKSGEARQSKTKQMKQMVKSRSKTKQNEHDNVNVNDTVNVNDINKEIEILYNDIVIYFDEDLRPKDKKQKNKWIDTLDKLIRIDNKTPELIKQIVKRARMDDFWRKNFMSILKLRQKDKNGIQYFLRFEKLFAGNNNFGIKDSSRTYTEPQTF